jgi:hypothetical protein
LAVFNAVSASPLRAPCVEMKYCRTFSPSRKLAVIGVSMIEPSGLAIRPRMPASWRICATEPRAPESAIIKMELNDSWLTSTPWRLIVFSVASCSIMTLPTWSPARPQMSTTLL